MNTLSNFASWADIFISALEGARAIQNFDLKELNGMWRSLLKRNIVRIEYMTTFVTACCIFHNVCEVHHGNFDDQWLDEEVQSSCTTLTPVSNSPSSATANAIRHALYDHIDRH